LTLPSATKFWGFPEAVLLLACQLFSPDTNEMIENGKQTHQPNRMSKKEEVR
jgi:hypothetical protein